MGFGLISSCSYCGNHVPVIAVGKNVWEMELKRQNCYPPIKVDGAKNGFNRVLMGAEWVEP